MSTFVLLPGAGGAGWYWSRVVPLLEAAGHRAVAVDLPAEDPKAGLEAYADHTVQAIGDRRDVVLVAQSLGGFTAAMAAARVPLGMLVFLNAMIPAPGETAGGWGEATGSSAARLEQARQQGYSPEFEVETYFFHDVPADVRAEADANDHDEAEISFRDPCRFDRWPDVPIHVIIGRHDRLFPPAFQRRVALERLKVDERPPTIDEVDGGHLAALSHPRAVADRLLSYVR